MKLVCMIFIVTSWLSHEVYATAGTDCACPFSGASWSGTETDFEVYSKDNASEIDSLVTALTGFRTFFTAIRACNASDVNACGKNSTCTVFSTNVFECGCDSGYDEDRKTASFQCVDHDECANNTHNCDTNADCTNTDGSFTCACHAGYSGNGSSCVDIDECLSNPCADNATCADLIDDYTCTCDKGFSGDGNNNCTNIDECAAGMDDCDSLANCTDTEGNYTCTCLTGFTGDGFTCDDTDECLASPCTDDATCTNTNGSYTCACDSGFSGDGDTACNNIDDCPLPSAYSPNGNCTDLVNAFTVACNAGYSGDGYNCSDIDECLVISPCHANAICENSNGSYLCTCNATAGFHGDGVTCSNTINVTTTFGLVCSSYAFVSNLSTAGTPEHTDLTNELTALFEGAILAKDGTAGVSVVFTFTSGEVSDTIVEAAVSITETKLSAAVVETELSAITGGATCDATPIPKCATTACDAGSVCEDKVYGACCFYSFDYLVDIVLNITFKPEHKNFTSPEYTGHKIEEYLQNIFANLSIKTGCGKAGITIEPIASKAGSLVVALRATFVNATYTVEDITAALKNASPLTTPAGTTVMSLGSYDACANDYANLRNCSQFANCLASDGSFSCNCNSSYFDNSTSGPSGTVCIVPVTIDCTATDMSVSIIREFYTNNNADGYPLHLFEETCTNITHGKSVGDSIEFTFNLTECNTTTTDNGTHIIIENEISNLPSAGIFTGPEIKIPVQCVLDSSVNFTFNYSGDVDVILLPPSVSIGSFTILLELYETNAFVTKSSKSRFLSTDTLHAQFSFANKITSSSVLVERCWGTAYASETSTPSLTFLDKCSDTSDLRDVVVHQNGDGNARISFGAFFFTLTREIHIHCTVSVCQGTCTNSTSCAKRRKRDAEEIPLESKTITIILSHDESEESFIPIDRINDLEHTIHSNNMTITIVAAILGFVLLVLLIAILVVVLRKRRSNKENYDLTHINMHAIDSKPPNYS